MELVHAQPKIRVLVKRTFVRQNVFASDVALPPDEGASQGNVNL
jgi:hypothetical protein